MHKYCLLFFSVIIGFLSCNQAQNQPPRTNSAGAELSPVVTDSLPTSPVDSLHLSEAKRFCQQQKLDTTIAFFVNMGIHSGKKRFFVYDLSTRTMLYSGLCCHGLGKGSTQTVPVFSNEKGSNCTSLGKYKLGARAFSNWGIGAHYKMHGLESTNTNAFSRIVVLHSYEYVPNTEIYPQHLPLGWSQGCPVITNQLMVQVDELLKNRKISVLLWIYK